jgi:hypothetical protein
MTKNKSIKKELAALLADQERKPVSEEAVERFVVKQKRLAGNGGSGDAVGGVDLTAGQDDPTAVPEYLLSKPTMFGERKRKREDAGAGDDATVGSSSWILTADQIQTGSYAQRRWVRHSSGTSQMEHLLSLLEDKTAQPSLTTKSAKATSSGERSECVRNEGNWVSFSEREYVELKLDSVGQPCTAEDTTTPVHGSGYWFSKADTQALFDLVRWYGTHFHVVHDRFQLYKGMQKKEHQITAIPERFPTVEELCYRFVAVTRAVLDSRKRRLLSLLQLQGPASDGAVKGDAATVLRSIAVLFDAHPLEAAHSSETNPNGGYQYFSSLERESAARAVLDRVLRVEESKDVELEAAQEALKDYSERFDSIGRRLGSKEEFAQERLGAVDQQVSEALSTARAASAAARESLNPGAYSAAREYIVVSLPNSANQLSRILEARLDKSIDKVLTDSSDRTLVMVDDLRSQLHTNEVLLKALRKAQNALSAVTKMRKEVRQLLEDSDGRIGDVTVTKV